MAHSLKPDISVIIPTIGRDKILVNTLGYLLRQKGAKFEIIIVDQNDGPGPCLTDFLKRHPEANITCYRQEEKNQCAALNLGALAASAATILFLDDDIEIDRGDFLMAHLGNYKDTAISGVCGQVLGPDRRTRNTRHPWSDIPGCGWLYFPMNYNARTILGGIGMSGNLSMRKDAFLSVGGLDENFEKGAYRQESEFIQRCEKKGHIFVFDPNSSIVHLGHPEGGIRSWGQSEGVLRMNHIAGEWYFTLKQCGRNNFIHYFVALFRRQIANPPNLRKPVDLLPAAVKSAAGFFVALRMLKRGELTLLSGAVRKRHQKTIEQSRMKMAV